MKIEDLTDFRPGDTVTVARETESGHSATITGEVWEDQGELCVGPFLLRYDDGTLAGWGHSVTAIDRPVTVPTGKYAVVVSALGYAYVRDEQDAEWPWNGGEWGDTRIRNILNDGGRIVFEGEG